MLWSRGYSAPPPLHLQHIDHGCNINASMLWLGGNRRTCNTCTMLIMMTFPPTSPHVAPARCVQQTRTTRRTTVAAMMMATRICHDTSSPLFASRSACARTHVVHMHGHAVVVCARSEMFRALHAWAQWRGCHSLIPAAPLSAKWGSTGGQDPVQHPREVRVLVVWQGQGSA